MRTAALLILAIILVSPVFSESDHVVYAASSPAPAAEASFVVSGSTGEVLYGEHENRKLQIAASTRLMTALVVVDRMHDKSELKNTLQISDKIDEHGDMFQAGDKVSVRDLLYALLRGDSAEAGLALAAYSAGSSKAFLEEMNSKAKEFGVVDTNYVNVSGEYNVKQFATAADTAVLLREVMRDPVLKEIMENKSHKIKVSGKTRDFTIENKNKISVKGTETLNLMTCEQPWETSVFYGLATQDGMDIIVVMLGCQEDSAMSDAESMFKYGFDNVTRQPCVQAGTEVGKVKVRGGAKTRIKVYTETKGYVYIPPEGSQSLFDRELVLYKGLKAPLSEGAKVGEYRIYVANEYKGSVDIVTHEAVPKGWILSNLYISNAATVVMGLIIAAFGILILRVRQVQKKREKLRRLERQRRIREEAARQRAIDEDRRRRNWTYR